MPTRRHPNRVRTVIQAAELQRLAYDDALALRNFTPTNLSEALARANALRSLGQLWDTARDAVRVAKGKPLPGSLRPKDKPRRPKRGNAAQPYAEPQGAAPEVMPSQPEQAPVPPSPSDSEGEQPAS